MTTFQQRIFALTGSACLKKATELFARRVGVVLRSAEHLEVEHE